MLGFFTRIPVPQIEYTEERYIKGIPLLPFVGAVSGGLLLCVYQLSRWLPMPVTVLALFLAYLLITGGLHLDGLGDSCDALFSGRDREKMLEIMKDSRSGSFGVLGLIFASAAYLVLLNYAPWQAVLLFPVIVLTGAGSVTRHKTSTKVCKFLGDISYPIYITHYPIMYMQMSWVEDHADAPVWIHVAVNVGVVIMSIIVAYGLLKAYDEPVREWLKEHWLKRNAKVAA